MARCLHLVTLGPSDPYMCRVLKIVVVGSTKFRPRAPDGYVPIKGDEFSSIEHNNDLRIALYEWPMLYGEALLVLMLVALFSPLFVGPVILYFRVTKSMRFCLSLLSTLVARKSGYQD
jgi:hypothetical protein